MKQSSKNETELLDLVNKIQAKLIELDMKIDTLMFRSPSANKPTAPKPVINNAPQQNRHNDHHQGRTLHTAICADCKKECTIPFKPSGDRPVYCQDCFSRRKVINMSGMKVEEKPQVNIQEPKAKEKKKPAAAKKPAAKKKATPKKK